MKWFFVFLAYLSLWCFVVANNLRLREIAAEIKVIKNNIAQQAKGEIGVEQPSVSR